MRASRRTVEARGALSESGEHRLSKGIARTKMYGQEKLPKNWRLL